MKKILFTLLFLSALSANSYAENYGSIRGVTFVRNYDGDTITVNLKNMSDIIGKEIPIRVNGVDTPEINGNCDAEKTLAESARTFVFNQLSNASKIILNNTSRGKYFRIIADVNYDGKDLASVLINNGLAVAYDGTGQRIDWCEYLN